MRRLLVIDARVLVRTGVRTPVAQHFAYGYRVDDAGALEHDLAALTEAAGRIALVLLDLPLPDVEGFAGLRILRCDHPAVPAAVLSEAHDQRIRDEALRLGAVPCICKAAHAGAMDAWV